MEAINLKQKHFIYIYVIGKDAEGIVRLKILKPPSEFIDQAREQLMRKKELTEE